MTVRPSDPDPGTLTKGWGGSPSSSGPQVPWRGKKLVRRCVLAVFRGW
jgi:hypothetical protein